MQQTKVEKKTVGGVRKQWEERLNADRAGAAGDAENFTKEFVNMVRFTECIIINVTVYHRFGLAGLSTGGVFYCNKNILNGYKNQIILVLHCVSEHKEVARNVMKS